LAQEQRRLAAILAADVAGYSRLMAADESGTLARLTKLRAEVIEPKIVQFHGRIVGSAGDSLLVEFASAEDLDKRRFRSLRRRFYAGRTVTELLQSAWAAVCQTCWGPAGDLSWQGQPPGQAR
jgi:class 3 adenylate cyclase